MRHRLPRQAPGLAAAEINAWNRLAAQRQRGEGARTSRLSPPPVDRGLMLVQNKSGSDRQRFDTMALGDLLYEPGPPDVGLQSRQDGSEAYIFTAVACDVDRDPIVLIQDIPNDEFGWVVVDGPCLAWVRHGGNEPVGGLHVDGHGYGMAFEGQHCLRSGDNGPVRLLVNIDDGYSIGAKRLVPVILQRRDRFISAFSATVIDASGNSYFAATSPGGYLSLDEDQSGYNDEIETATASFSSDSIRVKRAGRYQVTFSMSLKLLMSGNPSAVYSGKCGGLSDLGVINEFYGVRWAGHSGASHANTHLLHGVLDLPADGLITPRPWCEAWGVTLVSVLGAARAQSEIQGSGVLYVELIQPGRSLPEWGPTAVVM